MRPSNLRQDPDVVPIRRVQCPRCRRPPAELVETAHTFLRWPVTEDGRTRDGEGYSETGPVTCVRAVCACGHRWRLRGITQVTELDMR